MKPVVFPVATGLLVLATWLAVAAAEQCALPNTDPKFDCWSSVQIVAAFASIAAGLTAIAAGLARALLHRFLAFRSVASECLSAVLTSFVLVLLFSGIIYWEIGFGGIAGNFFAWLISSFTVSGASLVIVKRVFKQA